MPRPEKTHYFTDCRLLPFEPTMLQVQGVFNYFEQAYGAKLDEVVFEDRNDNVWMVFSRMVENMNYEKEFRDYEDEHLVQVRRAEEQKRQEKIQADGIKARMAWTNLRRVERIARRDLGRHTLMVR